MDTTKFLDKFGAPLPESIVAVLEATNRLEATLRSQVDEFPFPDLHATPVSDSEVERVVLGAAAWAAQVRACIGTNERQRAYGGRGLLPMFGPRSGFAHDDDPSHVLGAVPASLRSDPAREYYYFEWAFHAVEEPIQNCARSLTDATARSIPFDTEHWPRIRLKLQRGRELITDRAQSVVEWVFSAIHKFYGWTPPHQERVRAPGEGEADVDSRVAKARRAVGQWPGEWIPRTRLDELGVPPTSIDQHFQTDPGRFKGARRSGQAGGRVEYRRSFVLKFVRNVWRPRRPT